MQNTSLCTVGYFIGSTAKSTTDISQDVSNYVPKQVTSDVTNKPSPLTDW